jgi:DNA-binding response OmpR family regulator
MPVAQKALAGKRVLIVEDEILIALLLEDFLGGFGCTTVGPYRTVAQALDAARTEDLDLAVLDVNLCGERVYPVAEMLAERQIPFLLLSGYGDDAVPPDRTDWKVCSKPFKSEMLEEMLLALTEPAAR